jgi:hypothetical protein
MLIVMKEVRPSENFFLLISKYIEYKLRLIRPIMPYQNLIQEKFKTDQPFQIMPLSFQSKLVAGFVLRNTWR